MAGIRCFRMPTTTRCSPCSRHLWKPLRPPRTICLQSPISLRTRTSQNQHGAKHTGFRQQNPQAEQQLYTPPGGFECWHWSCKAELWSEQLAAQPKPPVKVDVSKIKVGVKVKHKAFGVGTVTAIQPDMVTVRFGSVEKKFLLPAAIVQGYLTLIEE